jgi:hypothetical protein
LFIIYAIILGILIGYLMDGKLDHLNSKPMHYKWTAFCALFIQVIIFSGFSFVESMPDSLIVTLHIGSYVCLLIFILANIRIKGILVIGLGTLLNSLVISLNGGYMPSNSEQLKVETTVIGVDKLQQSSTYNNVKGMTQSTVFPWLGDIFEMPSWLPFSNLFSIGDVFIAVGVLIYLIVNMQSPKSKGC